MAMIASIDVFQEASADMIVFKYETEQKFHFLQKWKVWISRQVQNILLREQSNAQRRAGPVQLSNDHHGEKH